MKYTLNFDGSGAQQTPNATSDHFAMWNELKERLAGLRLRLSGDPVRQSFSESTIPSISDRVGQVASGHWSTRQPPTKTYQDNIEMASRDFTQFSKDLRTYFEDLEKYEAMLEAAGAPYTRAEVLAEEGGILNIVCISKFLPQRGVLSV